MKVAYVSNASVGSAISYFKNMSIVSPEQLGMFFFFKALKFNDVEYVAFPKVSGISEDQRKEYLKRLYNLSALFDRNVEDGEKRCCLFPFSITNEIGSKHLFNPGTSFKGLLSRIRDTIDNTLVDSTKFLRKDDANPDYFKFPKDYIQILKNNFLNGQQISLVNFATWYFRFRGVECVDSWLDSPTNDLQRAFTRVCIKILIKELNLTEDELSHLFYFDESEIIIYSSVKISGEMLRSKLSFERANFPEIKTLPRGGLNYMNETDNIGLNIAEELAQPTGNNITIESLNLLLMASKQVILYGVPGTSKSYITNQIKSLFEKSITIQFHASLTYEQFIGGITVDNEGNFVSKSGVFLDFCEEARQDENSGKKYLFIIDEINRGNVSKIFGETIMTLDREYIADLVSPIKWRGHDVSRFSIPSNVYIIATMNSADRSIAQIDYAIRRRFAFVKFYPNYELISSVSDYSHLFGIKPDILLKSINKKIFTVLKDENMQLGHAYFMPKWAFSTDGKIHWTVDNLKMLVNYYIIPIIEEYTYGNTRYLSIILGSEIPKRIDNNNAFVEALKKQFDFR